MNGRPQEGLAILKEEIVAAEAARRLSAILPILRTAAIISIDLGDLPEAIRLYEMARSTRPSDPYVYLALSDIYEMVGDSTSAREYVDLFEKYADPVNDADLLEKVRDRQR
jgi:tetratricopeptide (TPR) repeat protein